MSTNHSRQQDKTKNSKKINSDDKPAAETNKHTSLSNKNSRYARETATQKVVSTPICCSIILSMVKVPTVATDKAEVCSTKVNNGESVPPKVYTGARKNDMCALIGGLKKARVRLKKPLIPLAIAGETGEEGVVGESKKRVIEEFLGEVMVLFNFVSTSFSGVGG